MNKYVDLITDEDARVLARLWRRMIERREAAEAAEAQDSGPES